MLVTARQTISSSTRQPLIDQGNLVLQLFWEYEILLCAAPL